MYFDNGATSWPKPDIVIEKIYQTLKEQAGSSGRGMSRDAVNMNRSIYKARKIISQLINAQDPMEIVFTKNCTEGLNLAIYGLLEENDHVITTSMEHNSVIRPLYDLKEKGLISLDIVEGDDKGRIDPEDFKKFIKKESKLIVSTHMSNLTGGIVDIKRIGEIAKEHNIHFLVDGAQSIGLVPIDVEEMNIDLLAFPGHKNLLGPQGTGGLYIKGDIMLRPIMKGGTGSFSEDLDQPQVRPDRYESGTLNGPGIIGLYYGVDYLMEEGIDNIYSKSMELTERFIQGIKEIEGIKIYGPEDLREKGPIVSFNLDFIDNEDLGYILDNEYSITTRTGYHCTPLGHKTVASGDTGSIRFSFSSFNSIQEVDRAIEALREIEKRYR